ncbi:hypothetical protein MJO29_005641 [Puccinia striiformis f. sp. tritici]|nr:hypothetical protein MJO29_005641 [Puccinia striiformis f. sp. tritici]
MVSAQEIKKHNSSQSCWIVVHGNAYDITTFLEEHPGGQDIILKYAGGDATEAYDPIHPAGLIKEYLDKNLHLGKVDESELKQLQPKANKKQKKSDEEGPPPLSTCLSLYDFESIASTRMTKQAWAYYSSGADDEISMRENRAGFQRIWFRPRILVNVSNIDYSTTILGTRTSIPLYITATALGKLGHPEGEKNLTIAAGSEDVIQMIPTLSSCDFNDLVDIKRENQVQWYQVYVNSNRSETEELIKNAELKGVKALFITVDAPQLGRREKDMRLKFEDLGSNIQDLNKDKIDRSQGATRAISSFIDPSLNWSDMAWLKSITTLPIILKGVQTWGDAVLARDHNLQGIVISNHGGRQLDYSLSAIEILISIVSELKARKMYDLQEFAIFVDGGIRRSSDIIKALCCGASAVGVGRPFLYAYSVYGHQGVVKAIRLLKDEMEMNMRLIGAPTIAHLKPEMVDLSALKNRFIDANPDFKARQNYQPLPKL